MTVLRSTPCTCRVAASWLSPDAPSGSGSRALCGARVGRRRGRARSFGGFYWFADGPVVPAPAPPSRQELPPPASPSPASRCARGAPNVPAGGPRREKGTPMCFIMVGSDGAVHSDAPRKPCRGCVRRVPGATVRGCRCTWRSPDARHACDARTDLGLPRRFRSSSVTGARCARISSAAATAGRAGVVRPAGADRCRGRLAARQRRLAFRPSIGSEPDARRVAGLAKVRRGGGERRSAGGPTRLCVRRPLRRRESGLAALHIAVQTCSGALGPTPRGRDTGRRR